MKTKGSVSFCTVRCGDLHKFPEDMEVIMSMRQAKSLGIDHEPVYATTRKIKAAAPVSVREVDAGQVDVQEVTG